MIPNKFSNNTNLINYKDCALLNSHLQLIVLVRSELCQVSKDHIYYEQKINRLKTLSATILRSFNKILVQQPRVLAQTVAQRRTEKKSLNSQEPTSQPLVGIRLS